MRLAPAAVFLVLAMVFAAPALFAQTPPPATVPTQAEVDAVTTTLGKLDVTAHELEASEEIRNLDILRGKFEVYPAIKDTEKRPFLTSITREADLITARLTALADKKARDRKTTLPLRFDSAVPFAVELVWVPTDAKQPETTLGTVRASETRATFRCRVPKGEGTLRLVPQDVEGYRTIAVPYESYILVGVAHFL